MSKRARLYWYQNRGNEHAERFTYSQGYDNDNEGICNDRCRAPGKQNKKEPNLFIRCKCGFSAYLQRSVAAGKLSLEKTRLEKNRLCLIKKIIPL